MTALEILPPQPPRRKLQLVTRKLDVPLVEPPKMCLACRDERAGNAFTPLDPGRSSICDHCKRPFHVRGIPWSVEAKWSDRVLFEDARYALTMLERQIDNV